MRVYVCVCVCACGERGIDIGCPGLAVNGMASYGQNVSSMNQIKIIKCIHTYIREDLEQMGDICYLKKDWLFWKRGT